MAMLPLTKPARYDGSDPARHQQGTAPESAKSRTMMRYEAESASSQPVFAELGALHSDNREAGKVKIAS
jgi:hypothetical protein